jgi:membrane protease YdiL (CAAX protease family)
MNRKLRIHIPHLKVDEQADVALSQVILLFVLPVILLYFHIFPIESRLVVLLVFSLLIFGIIRKEGWKDEDVGLSFRKIRQALPAYTIATIVGVIFIILVANTFHLTPPFLWWMNRKLLALFVFVSVFQEFAFRGFLIPVLGKIFHRNFAIVLINAVLFAGMHSIYSFPIIALPVAFVGGLVFAGLYIKYPNLILISIMHCILNFVAVGYGFFAIAH